MKVNICRRPNWWLRIVRDYEDNVLGSRYATWPSNKITQIQMKNRYNFYLDPELEYIEFEKEKDYIMFSLKWS
jgi:hypothetical protein